MPTVYTNKSARDLQVVDPVLTNLAVGYRPDGFIADRLFPRIGVQVDSGLYPTFPKEYWFRRQTNPKVDDRAETPEVDFVWSTSPYLCEDYRLKASITAKERRQAHRSLRMEEQKLELVQNQLALWREVDAAAKLRNTANGGLLETTLVQPSNNWNVDAATIEVDIKTAKNHVYKATARVPNTIVIPYLVACEIAIQADVREILKYTVNGQQILNSGEAILPSRLWGMDVLIPKGSLQDTGTEGAAADNTMDEIWGDSVRLLYLAPGGGGWGMPSVGYNFSVDMPVVDTWHENDPPVDYLRCWESRDQRVVAPLVGVEIEAVLS